MTDKMDELKQELTGLIDQYTKYKRFYDQQLAQLPFKVGDKVALTRDVVHINYGKAPGWRSYKPIMQPDNLGTIRKVYWNPYFNNDRGCWNILFEFELEWYMSEDRAIRHAWIKPDGRRHTFCMPFNYIRHRTVMDDEVILPPRDLDRYVVTPLPDYGSEEITYTEVVERFGGRRHASK
jgi:hypothetical protein